MDGFNILFFLSLSLADYRSKIVDRVRMKVQLALWFTPLGFVGLILIAWIWVKNGTFIA